MASEFLREPRESRAVSKGKLVRKVEEATGMGGEWGWHRLPNETLRELAAVVVRLRRPRRRA